MLLFAIKQQYPLAALLGFIINQCLLIKIISPVAPPSPALAHFLKCCFTSRVESPTAQLTIIL